MTKDRLLLTVILLLLGVILFMVFSDHISASPDVIVFITIAIYFYSSGIESYLYTIAIHMVSAAMFYPQLLCLRVIELLC